MSLGVATKIGARNLLRARRRTVLTGLVLAVTFFGGVLSLAMENGSFVTLIENGARSGQGHVTVRARATDGDERLLGLAELARVQSAVEAVARRQPLRLAAARLVTRAMAETAHGVSALRLIGYDAGTDTALLPPSRLAAGAALPPGDAGSVILGDLAARRLAVAVGDRVLMTAHLARGGDLHVVPLQVAALFHTGVDALDGGAAYVTRATARTLVGSDGASYVAVQLASADGSDAAQAALAAALPGLEVVTWRETMPDLDGLIRTERFARQLVKGAFLIVIALLLMNTMLMAALERRQEWAVLSAIGAGPMQLVATVLAEALTLAVASISAGAMLAWPVYRHLARHGLDLRQFSNADWNGAGVALDPILYPALTRADTLWLALLLVLVTAASTVPPALSVARTDPAKVFGR